MVDKDRKMSIEDFREQEKRIQNDERYTLEMKQWAIMHLTSVFFEINGCLPCDGEKDGKNTL